MAEWKWGHMPCGPLCAPTERIYTFRISGFRECRHSSFAVVPWRRPKGRNGEREGGAEGG